MWDQNNRAKGSKCCSRMCWVPHKYHYSGTLKLLCTQRTDTDLQNIPRFGYIHTCLVRHTCRRVDMCHFPHIHNDCSCSQNTLLSANNKRNVEEREKQKMKQFEKKKQGNHQGTVNNLPLPPRTLLLSPPLSLTIYALTQTTFLWTRATVVTGPSLRVGAVEHLTCRTFPAIHTLKTSTAQ